MKPKEKKPENPGAFPIPNNVKSIYKEGIFVGNESGMTLRDYFAAKAMQVYLQKALKTNIESDESISKASYFTADAMLKEREK